MWTGLKESPWYRQIISYVHRQVSNYAVMNTRESCWDSLTQTFRQINIFIILTLRNTLEDRLPGSQEQNASVYGPCAEQVNARMRTLHNNITIIDWLTTTQICISVTFIIIVITLSLFNWRQAILQGSPRHIEAVSNLFLQATRK